MASAASDLRLHSQIPKHDFEHFRLSHRLARYDFLLVFCSDLRSSLNRCQRITMMLNELALPRFEEIIGKYRCERHAPITA